MCVSGIMNVSVAVHFSCQILQIHEIALFTYTNKSYNFAQQYMNVYSFHIYCLTEEMYADIGLILHFTIHFVMNFKE